MSWLTPRQIVVVGLVDVRDGDLAGLRFTAALRSRCAVQITDLCDLRATTPLTRTDTVFALPF